jgi:hypothetical protein
MPDIAVSTTVAAPPEAVWDLVADLPRMGEWSPETTKVTWRKGATAAAVGASFTGRNELGKRRWSTTGKIVECRRGEVLAFDVFAGPIRYSRWTYRFAPAEGGCTVTEEWDDGRPRWMHPLGALVSGVKDRDAHNRAGMEQTLANLKRAAEGATSPAG